jgi:CRISPR system Cascade subunit CasA
MSDTKYDLLAERLLRVREPVGTMVMESLATTLARLSRGDEIEFCALQAHQEHAWHAFLVQVAAIVLHRESATVPYEDGDKWRDVLRDLAAGPEAWCLVVPDLSQPAFLQPPVPERSLTTFTREQSPDDLDVLVTAKNHDLKRSRVTRAAAEHWTYLLVSVQTMGGYPGRNTYGIARMNGGLGNRPHVAYAPDLGRAACFLRDVRACLDGRATAVEHRGYANTKGLALTWTLPWDGCSSIALDKLDPWFVETCRRIRLVEEGGRIVAWRCGTKGPRVAPLEGGDTADPWTPVDRITGKALTVSAAGFGYDRTQELLLGGQFAMGAAGTIRPDDGPAPWFVASAMVRGQGRTDGIHERRVRVPAPVRALLRSTGGRDRLRDRSKRWVASAKIAKLNVLGPALSVLVGEGDGTKAARGRFFSAMDAAIDRVFFERLWATAEADDAEADTAWARDLVGLAKAQLAEAIDAAPARAAARYRVIADAENLLEGCARKRFPSAFDDVARRPT